jgi:flagellar biosynthetic protein FliR
MTSFDDAARIGVLLVRPGMLIIGTPFLGAVSVPAVMRVGLTVLIALLLAPLVAVPTSLSAGTMGIVVLREVAIGLSLALAIRVLVFGAEFAGHFTGYSIGLSIGSLIDPQTGVRNNIFAVLYTNLAIVTIFMTNAHHRLLEALFDSYRAAPVGLGGVDPSLGGHVAHMLGLVFVIGVRIAAPVVVVLMVVELALGLIARVAPALNVMISGAPIRLAVGLLVAAATVTVLPQVVSRYVPTALKLAADTAQAFR